jgi:hypothetical protein
MSPYGVGQDTEYGVLNFILAPPYSKLKSISTHPYHEIMSEEGKRHRETN